MVDVGLEGGEDLRARLASRSSGLVPVVVAVYSLQFFEVPRDGSESLGGGGVGGGEVPGADDPVSPVLCCCCCSIRQGIVFCVFFTLFFVLLVFRIFCRVDLLFQKY